MPSGSDTEWLSETVDDSSSYLPRGMVKIAAMKRGFRQHNDTHDLIAVFKKLGTAATTPLFLSSWSLSVTILAR